MIGAEPHIVDLAIQIARLAWFRRGRPIRRGVPQLARMLRTDVASVEEALLAASGRWIARESGKLHWGLVATTSGVTRWRKRKPGMWIALYGGSVDHDLEFCGRMSLEEFEVLVANIEAAERAERFAAFGRQLAGFLTEPA